MIYKSFQDISLSRLGMGNMRLPVQGDKAGAPIDYPRAQEIIDYAMSNGINYYDSAYVYHNGESEKFLGEALKKYPRDSYYLATKFLLFLLALAVWVFTSDHKIQEDMTVAGFSELTNVEITGVFLEDFDAEQLSVLYQQARYCQAMTDADTAAMRQMISEDMVFTHMSGRQQSREEYLTDIENGSLRYFTIGIEKPVVEVDGDLASVTFTSVLNANAYGARGTYRMSGAHWYEKRDGDWIAINNPNK